MSSEIDYTHPFVVRQYNKLRLIEKFVYQYKLKNSKCPVLYGCDKPYLGGSWAQQDVNWYNHSYATQCHTIFSFGGFINTLAAPDAYKRHRKP